MNILLSNLVLILKKKIKSVSTSIFGGVVFVGGFFGVLVLWTFFR